MGTQLDSDKSSAALEYKQAAILDIGTYLLERITKIWLHNEFIFRKIHAGKKFDKTLDTIHSFADNVIVEKKQQRTHGNVCMLMKRCKISNKSRK
ncbi:Cytochrome P450 [Operophtera brumata]|uniref:Cytochrome P450 n=1 Tax=Operophtera brumata TaxID=104452 RepID=A0A0L7L7P1_OPEBR|nr:Cytochrome P450 [Operophtera brumata]